MMAQGILREDEDGRGIAVDEMNMLAPDALEVLRAESVVEVDAIHGYLVANQVVDTPNERGFFAEERGASERCKSFAIVPSGESPIEDFGCRDVSPCVFVAQIEHRFAGSTSGFAFTVAELRDIVGNEFGVMLIDDGFGDDGQFLQVVGALDIIGSEMELIEEATIVDGMIVGMPYELPELCVLPFGNL